MLFVSNRFFLNVFNKVAKFIISKEFLFWIFFLDITTPICYNSMVLILGYGVTATHKTLTLALKVRVLLSQPQKKDAVASFFVFIIIDYL